MVYGRGTTFLSCRWRRVELFDSLFTEGGEVS